MKRYRTPIFLAVWAVVGLAALAVLMPSLHVARDGASPESRATMERREQAQLAEMEAYAAEEGYPDFDPDMAYSPSGADDWAEIERADDEWGSDATEAPAMAVQPELSPADGVAASTPSKQQSMNAGPAWAHPRSSAAPAAGFNQSQRMTADSASPHAGIIRQMKDPESAAPEQAPPEAEIDRILAGLKSASIAFNTPEEIPYGDSAVIELRMSATQAQSSLAADVRGAGAVETARVKFAKLMQAELTGLGFEIEAITPDTQAISGAEPTVWRWQIEPVRTDVQPLHLTLSARVKIDGESVMRSIKTFDKEIRVRVPLMQRVGDLVFGNLEIVCTLVLAPLAAVAWRKLRKPKQPVAEPPARVAA
ncbi:hypothetical protein Pla175_16970 [Pirellulimonas nuda]|uniref:Uncharacterized protein n=1 Tax=Pirellulimonas nuda TaxID=2528009 RepID=A0A518DA09_9BACT|nr:hypothetical protein [Pirellulimonas nuda]QDU88322.1 hypothetical protein Pla175_16970 [Pirellulimonas nuda]